MHGSNREWLAYAQDKYGERWRDRGVLEVGSLNINGEAREVISGAPYVGVDFVDGPGVDVVVDARQTVFDRKFGCFLCTSVFEHTPHWREIIGNNLQWLEPGAILLLGWGAEGNLWHEPEPWAPVPVGDMLEYLAPLCDIKEAYWEGLRWTTEIADGFYDVIAELRP